jgi:hypothetical protein
MARKIAPYGLVTMLVLLVATIVLLPWAVRLLMRSVSGFENSMPVPPSPSVMRDENAMNMQYIPDRNTNYICRSPNDSGVPCPEGEFCDGTSQSCQKLTVPSVEQISGYFS